MPFIVQMLVVQMLHRRLLLADSRVRKQPALIARRRIWYSHLPIIVLDANERLH